MQRELFQNVWVEKGWKRSIANPYSKECVKARGMLVLLSSALFFYGRPRQGHEWTQKLGKAGARGALLVRTRPQRGGGDPPPLYGPQNCRTEQGALSAPEAPEILF